VRYLLGYRVDCGCVTAALRVDETTTQKEMGRFMRSMITTGRAVRPSDDLTAGLVSCPHRRQVTVTPEPR
jgi:hypothetical protein